MNAADSPLFPRGSSGIGATTVVPSRGRKSVTGPEPGARPSSGGAGAIADIPIKQEAPTSFGSTSQGGDDDEIDALLGTIHAKLAHFSLSGTPQNPVEAHEMNSIANLLPYEAHAIAAALQSDVIEYVANGVVALRKYLSLDKIPNAINNVLDLRPLPILSQILAGPASPPGLLYETCWVLTNIAAGTHAQTLHLLTDCPRLLSNLTLLVASHPDTEVQIQALWALGNVAGDGSQGRAAVVEAGGVEAAVAFAMGHGLVETDLAASMPTPSGSRSPLTRAVASASPSRGSMSDADKVQVSRITAWFAANLCRGVRTSHDWSFIQPLVPIMTTLLLHSDLETVVDAAWGLARALLAVGPASEEDRNSEALTDTDILPLHASHFWGQGETAERMCARLIDLLQLRRFETIGRGDAGRLRTPILRALTNVASGADDHTALLVRLGAPVALYSIAVQGLLPYTVHLPPPPAALGDAHTSSGQLLRTASVSPAYSREALLVLSNIAAAQALGAVSAMFDAAPVADLWYAILAGAALGVPLQAMTMASPAATASEDGSDNPWTAMATRVRTGSATKPVANGKNPMNHSLLMDRRAVREAIWGVANATSGHSAAIVRQLTAAADRAPGSPHAGDWRGVLLALVAFGTRGMNEIYSGNHHGKNEAANILLAPSSSDAEIRDKAADALYNFVAAAGPAWLGEPHIAALDRAVAWVPKRESRVRMRVAAVRELVVHGWSLEAREIAVGGSLASNGSTSAGGMARMDDMVGAVEGMVLE